MVDLAKIRKKAKRSDTRQPPPDTASEKLEKFLARAGTKRAGIVPEAPPAAAADELHLLTFALGGEQYGIDITRVAEIITARPVTRVPNADPFVLGIVSVRGAIVTLVDVRTKLRQPRREPSPAGRIVVVRDGNGLAGFEVDFVLRPTHIDRASIEPQPMVHPSEASEAILGVHRGAGALTILLDLDKLLPRS